MYYISNIFHLFTEALDLYKIKSRKCLLEKNGIVRTCHIRYSSFRENILMLSGFEKGNFSCSGENITFMRFRKAVRSAEQYKKFPCEFDFVMV